MAGQAPGEAKASRGLKPTLPALALEYNFGEVQL